MEETKLTAQDLDTLGEILNISMGASATAISTMLSKQVIITTPRLELKKSEELDYSDIEPALIVKIQYIEGLTGTNVMLFRCRDMHIILHLLMGNDDISDIPDDVSDFDEMGISAACEVTNQMMGSSATAMSELLGMPVNISTPEAFMSPALDKIAEEMHGIEAGTDVVSIAFDLLISDVINTNFVSIMPVDFAQEIVHKLMGDQGLESGQPPVAEAAPTPPPAAPQQPEVAAPVPQQPPQAPPMQQPAYPPQQEMPQAPIPQPGYPPQPDMGQPPMQPYPQQPYMQPGYPPQQPYPQQPMQGPAGVMHPGYSVPPGYYMAPMPHNQPSFAGPNGSMLTDSPVNVKRAEFPEFYNAASIDPMNNSSMGLLMNVALDVSVEIGRTKRKIKEIIEFGQGTVIELEKQAGAPVDIVVNGQLLAHGDVVVIGDNFGVRITEIVGVKELMDSLNNPK